MVFSSWNISCEVNIDYKVEIFETLSPFPNIDMATLYNGDTSAGSLLTPAGKRGVGN
jgi:hypothetical protein